MVAVDFSPESRNVIEFIKANSRVLYGRHRAYDIIIGCSPADQYPGKAQVCLICYEGSSDPNGKVLRVERNEQRNIDAALVALHTGLKKDIMQRTEKFEIGMEFSGALMDDPK